MIYGNTTIPPVWEIAVHLAVADDVFDGVFLCFYFSPLDVLDEIWDLIESVSEGFPTYSCYSVKMKNYPMHSNAPRNMCCLKIPKRFSLLNTQVDTLLN